MHPPTLRPMRSLTRRVVAAFTVLAVAAGTPGQTGTGARAVPLQRTSTMDRALEPKAIHRYSVTLRRGESAEIVVTQHGVDIVLELLAPDGKRINSSDAPNGRNGDERMEIVAEADAAYTLVVRPFDDSEPAGRYFLAVTTWRDPDETRRLLAERAAARRLASDWFRARSGAIRLADGRVDGNGLARFDELAARYRVLGLGEATHGSREFGDLRLALTRRLVERHRVRVVALEASSARMRQVDAWTGAGAGNADELTRMLGPGWINRRAFHALAEFVRRWNEQHPGDPVSLVGLDAQDNAPARETLEAFAGRTGDRALIDRVRAIDERLAKADAEASVFGPVRISAEDWLGLKQLVGTLEVERPVLAARLGDGAVRDAVDAARTLVEFAEFNTDSRDPGRRTRDWFMAANLLRVLGPRARAVYWGHNAHVAHPTSRPGSYAPAGTVLHEVLGDGYASLATAFLEGGFLAQLPNDPGDRLAHFSLPPSPQESIDAVLDGMGIGDAVVTWSDGKPGEAPAWLGRPQPMHWVGGLYSDQWLPHQQSQQYSLLKNFDGVAYLRKVTAETVPEIGKWRDP